MNLSLLVGMSSRKFLVIGSCHSCSQETSWIAYCPAVLSLQQILGWYKSLRRSRPANRMIKLLKLLGQSRERMERKILVIENIYVNAELWKYVLSCILPAEQIITNIPLHIGDLLPTLELLSPRTPRLRIVGTA